MTNIIEQHLPEIQQLMREYGVQKAFAFGSALKNNMTADSDIDFLISMPEDMHYETYANNYFNLAKALETLLKKRVDLVAEETLSNPYFIESINRNKLQVL
jgi:predicted nucleotidyltransferase